LREVPDRPDYPKFRSGRSPEMPDRPDYPNLSAGKAPDRPDYPRFADRENFGE